MSQSCDPCDRCETGCGRVPTPLGLICRTCVSETARQRRDSL